MIDFKLLLGQGVRWIGKDGKEILGWIGGVQEDGTLIVCRYRTSKKVRLISPALRRKIDLQMASGMYEYVPYLRGVARIKESPYIHIKRVLHLLQQMQMEQKAEWHARRDRMIAHEKALNAQFAREQREWEENSHIDVW